MVGPPVRSGWPNVDHVASVNHRSSVPWLVFSNTSSGGPSTPEFGAPPLLDDATLLAKARAAANGGRFTALFDNGEHDRGRYSNAVFRLCQYLAFWGNANESTIDRLFRQSALYREAAWVAPYKGGTYGASVIAAVVSRTEF